MTRTTVGWIIRAVTTRHDIARVVASVAFVCLASTACNVHGVGGPSSLTSMVVSPASPSLGIHVTQQFTARATDLDGNSVPITPEWSIVNGGGSITSSGMFTAGSVLGTFASTVVAKRGHQIATATVTVTAGALPSVAISPAPTTMLTGTNRLP
jgi:hypothetical protein